MKKKYFVTKSIKKGRKYNRTIEAVHQTTAKNFPKSYKQTIKRRGGEVRNIKEVSAKSAIRKASRSKYKDRVFAGGKSKHIFIKRRKYLRRR